VRDLTTGTEVVYASLTRAAAALKICSPTVRRAYLDQPRPARGRHVRSFAAKRYWQPPATLVYDKTGFVKMAGDYIVRTSQATGDRVMYECATEAGKFNGITPAAVRKAVATGLPLDGNCWTIAAESEYATWVDVQ
jgi:hypothetical protein